MGLLWTFGDVAKIVVVRLQELPDHRNCENHDQADGGPDCNGVVAHSDSGERRDLNALSQWTGSETCLLD